MILHGFGWKCTLATGQKCSHKALKACLLKVNIMAQREEFNPLSQVLPARSLKEKNNHNGIAKCQNNYSFSFLLNK